MLRVMSIPKMVARRGYPVPNSTGTTATYTVTGLTNGTAANFQVRAVKNGIPGTATATAAATPKAPDTTKPTVTITSTPKSGIALPKTGDLAGKVVFKFQFDEALGTGSDAFTASDDVTISGMKSNTLPNFATPEQTGTANLYELTVEPASATTDVTVTITGVVQDTNNLNLDKAGSTPTGATYTYKHYDTIPPRVLAMLGEEVTATGADKDRVVDLTFVFDEPIEGFDVESIDRTRTNVLLGPDPAKDSTYVFNKTHVGMGIVPPPDPIVQPSHPERVEAWTLRVKRRPGVPKTDSIIVSIRTQSITDASTGKNELPEDFIGTYVDPAEKVKPQVKIASANTFLKQRKKNAITITLTDNVGVTDGLTSATSAPDTSGEVIVTGAQISDFVGGKSTVTLNVTPYIGTVQVVITVPAGKVKDADGNGNDKAELKVEVGPVLKVPGGPNGGFLVITKNDSDPVYQFLSDAPYQTSVQQVIDSVAWNDFPDLERLFNIQAASTAIGGKGGCALILKKPTRQAVLAVGAVRISEIMWASDLKYIGARNDAEARNQWIEIFNPGTSDVYVHLFDRRGGEAITIESNEIDRAGNFYDTNLGSNHWEVPGQNGNSHDGKKNFISMYRKNVNDNGMKKANWAASVTEFLAAVSTNGTLYHHVGTPGRPNPSATEEPPIKKTTKVESNKIIFNEVANRSNANQAYEWIELRNVSDDANPVNLKNYKISVITAVGTETELYTFPNNDNTKIPKGGILLLVESEPKNNRNHPLQIGTGVSYMVVDFKAGGLPDSGNFVLVLRGKTDNKGVGIGNNQWEHILDIAGYHPNLKKEDYHLSLFDTSLWPFYDFNAPSFTHNKLEVEKVHQRVRGAKGLTGVNDGRSGVGAEKNDNNKSAFADISYTGVGYKRLSATTAANGGTPGYPNNAFATANVGGSVYISEIMYADNAAGVLPQWIELRNTSHTNGVNLHNFRLSITNHRDMADRSAWRGKAQGSILLANLRIKPNSTVLIASRRAVQTIGVPTVYMPDSDIFILWNVNKGAFGMGNANDDIFNTHGFKITLEAKSGNNWQLVDTVSNLSKNKDTLGRTNERFDAPRWMWPAAKTENGHRISLVRKRWTKGGTVNKIAKGDERWGWQLSNEDPGHKRVAAITYYGNINDISSPGQTDGQPLPVELSAFQPTLEDGKVVVRWTTESELDNAGFNIYRSETRDGEFKQVNAQLIQGAGTTGERNAYEWVDTTAKPDVVYYYQIEDVSFSGERQTLAQSRLKGYVSAKNKLTTRWGELKKTLQ